MDVIIATLKRYEHFTKNTDLLLALGILVIMAVMLIPLPAFVLDLSLTFSLSLAILVLLVALYIQAPIEFSIFPSLLLITTLFRLALNVATTRIILSEGHQGPEAAGQVINAFGNFVVGNNYVIGAIVFIILVVINFIVITKGAGRVAEVAARFTLDAMPGKQMAIDADLNSGLINEAEARKRRKDIESEADFYGAMDGASKFTRGDAIAGIIITLINIIGGLTIGVFQKGLDMSTAAAYYTMLTIGDGLLSQIPALIISTAAGIVVTRSSKTEKNMGADVFSQLLLKPKAVGVAGSVVIALGFVPGLPTLPFFIMGIILVGLSYLINEMNKAEEIEKAKLETEALTETKKESIDSLLPLDLLELEVGYGLINVVEGKDSSSDLIERIASIRKQFALDLGIIVPSIHIRDNLQLQPGEYRFLIKGNRVGGGQLKADHLMAMDPGNITQKVPGIPTREPAFGLEALWIAAPLREEAEMAGYTVVDLSTVMATHLTEIIRLHAHELLGRQEANQLIDNFKKNFPKVVDDLIPEVMSLGSVVKVMQNLLREQISIRDLRTILETLADEGQRTKDIEVLTESVRRALARTITAKFVGEDQSMLVLTLSPDWEEYIANNLLQTEHGVQLVMDPKQAQRLINQVAQSVERHPEIAGQPILLTSPTARRHLYKLISRFLPQVVVLAHSELSQDVQIKSVESLELSYAS